MEIMDRILIDPGVLVGKPVVRGTRISVELVVERLAKGWSAEEIMRQYPQLTADDVRACLAYAAQVLRSERIYPIPV